MTFDLKGYDCNVFNQLAKLGFDIPRNEDQSIDQTVVKAIYDISKQPTKCQTIPKK